MRAVNLVKAALWVALFAGMSVAGVKYVAVVETEIDMEPDDAANLKKSEVRLITDELRGAAVKILPPDKYSVMTTETVMAQSGSVLEQCSEENCMITLGSKIGADYIVRGKISKVEALFALSVSIFDTEDGFLVGSMDAVRSERMTGLLEKAGSACAEMFKTFINMRPPAASPPAPARPQPAVKEAAKPEPPPVLAKPEPVPAPSMPELGGIVNVPEDAKTISEAMDLTRRNGYNYNAIQVAPGVYRERVVMAPGTTLVSTSPFEAKIDGGGRGIVITMAENSSVVGFEIRNGTIGVFSDKAGNGIRACRVVNNWMTGILAKRNLPQIEDNIIAFNGASGIQTWDIRPTAATVNHNTIAYNGNYGIAVGGSSAFVIENNVIAFNELFGLKISREPERIQVSTNNFYGNSLQLGTVLPKNNYAFNPAFSAPLAELNFKPDPDRCCKEKSANGENLGARPKY
jgi:hypothetical protein